MRSLQDDEVDYQTPVKNGPVQHYYANHRNRVLISGIFKQVKELNAIKATMYRIAENLNKDTTLSVAHAELPKKHLLCVADDIRRAVETIKCFAVGFSPHAPHDDAIATISMALVQLKNYLLDDAEPIFAKAQHDLRFRASIRDEIEASTGILLNLKPILEKLPDHSDELLPSVKEYFDTRQKPHKQNHYKTLMNLCSLRDCFDKLGNSNGPINRMLDSQTLPEVGPDLLNEWRDAVARLQTVMDITMPALHTIAEHKPLIDLESGEGLHAEGKESPKLRKAREQVVELQRLPDSIALYLATLDKMMEELPDSTKEQQMLLTYVSEARNIVINRVQPLLHNGDNNFVALQEYYHANMNRADTARSAAI